MRNNLAVALLALLGSANAQWKAERHFEEGGTSVNPIYRETRQLEQYYSAYRKNLKYICIFVNCIKYVLSMISYHKHVRNYMSNCWKVTFQLSARPKLGFHFLDEPAVQVIVSDAKLLLLLLFSSVVMSFMKSNQLLILSSAFCVNLKREFAKISFSLKIL